MEKDKKNVYHDPPLIATVFYARELYVDIKRIFHSCNEIPQLFPRLGTPVCLHHQP